MKGLFYISILLAGISCNKEEVGPQFPVDPLFSGDKVLILNEGNFGWGNASITAYGPNNLQTVQGAYFGANDLPLGDVCQSGIRWANRYLVVVNNSNKIVLLDTNTLEQVVEVPALGSPRYVLPTHGGKAYVSDLYANELGLLDISKGEFVFTITVPGWVEEMEYVNGFLYGTCPQNDQIIQLDTASNEVIDSISIPAGPSSLVKDRNGMLWALSSGFSGANARITMVDPAANAVIKTFEFGAGEQPVQLKINGEGDVLYYMLGAGVYKMPIESTSLSAAALISGYGQTLYGLSINPATEEIYVMDAKDFIQPGEAYRFTRNGELIDSIECGIIPQAIVF